MIKINLVREGGRAAVRGTAAPTMAAAAGPANINNLLLVGLLVVGILVAGGYWFFKNRELKSLDEQVAARTAEAQKLESIIREVEQFQERKASLEKRIALINDLKRNQKGPVRILDRVSQDLPDLVWLEELTLAGNMITVRGRALNPNAVANFVENVKNDEMFDEPQVGRLVQEAGQTGVSVYAYDMTFNFQYPAEAEATAAAGDATTTAAPGGAAGM